MILISETACRKTSIERISGPGSQPVGGKPSPESARRSQVGPPPTYNLPSCKDPDLARAFYFHRDDFSGPEEPPAFWRPK